MNARLMDLMVQAETKLGPEAQERLAEVVEAFVASWSEEVAFTVEEMARLREIDAEPFEEADGGEVKVFFRRRGQCPLAGRVLSPCAERRAGDF